MRVTIGVKIFGIAVGLLILMAVVALLSSPRGDPPVRGDFEDCAAKLLVRRVGPTIPLQGDRR
jgi:hypothetical protein